MTHPTSDLHIARLDVEMVPAQGRSIRFVGLLSTAVLGRWSAVASHESALALSADTDDLLVTWSDALATSSIGRSWTLRLDGDDKVAGRVTAARPQVTPGPNDVTITVSTSSTTSVDIVVGGTGPTGATGATGATGPAGADGADASYSDATPVALGTATPGTVDAAAREGHVHPMPSAHDVDAVPVTSIGLLAGERNRGDWDIAATYAVGDLVHDHGGDGGIYVANAASTGEQPSLGLGSWTVTSEVGRNITIGAGATADTYSGAAYGFLAEAGAFGTAIGAVTSGMGDASTAIGYMANASGIAAAAFGSAASAGGYGATSVGTQAAAPGDGDVNLGNIILGHVETSTFTSDQAIVVPGGGIDLAETVLATDPAADHQRIVARTDGIYVRDEAGTEVGPLIAEAVAAGLVASPQASGGIGYRPPDFGTWWTALAAKAAATVDVVVIGDSVASQDSTYVRGWPWHLQYRLNGKVPSPGMTAGWRVAQAGISIVPGFTTNAGTATTTTPGGNGVTMTNGQKATITATMDGFSLVYTTDPAYGSLIVRDGVGGTVLTTISCAAAAKSGNVWTSGALTSASHTIEVESVNNTKWAGGFVHVGNRTSGARVWNIGKSGWTTADVNTAARSLDFIDNMDPDLVILCTGTNDPDSATYNTRMRAMVAAVQGVYAGPIAVVAPHRSAAVDYAATTHTIAADLGLGIVDHAALLGNVPIESTRWAGLSVHPNPEGALLFADGTARVLTGDPLGEAVRSQPNVTGQTWADGATSVVMTSSTMTTTNGASTVLVGGPSPEVTLTAGAKTSTLFTDGLRMGGDTYFQRMSAGTYAVGSALSILLSSPDGVVWGGRRQAIDAQTGTSYAFPLTSIGKLVTRSNGSASTMTWPKDATQAVPVGSIIEVLNLGAGTITHSAEASASLVTGSTTSQAQGKRITAYKTAANTWLLS